MIPATKKLAALVQPPRTRGLLPSRRKNGFRFSKEGLQLANAHAGEAEIAKAQEQQSEHRTFSSSVIRHGRRRRSW